MPSILTINPVLRAIGIISAVAILVTGVTFAQLSDSASLVSNTMTSDTADLKVSNGGSFADSVAGFNPINIVPGEGVEYPFYLANGSDFDMTVTVTVPTLPSVTGVATFADVEITITGDDGVCTDPVETDLAALNAGSVALPCNPLLANSQGSGSVTQEGNFLIEFDFNPAGVSGTQASVDAFDLVFTGEQAS